MSVKRKISFRKILQTAITVAVVVTCCFAIMSAAEVQQKKKLKGIKISIKNEQYQFIDKKEIKKLLQTQEINFGGKPLGKLDVHKMEDTIKTIPWVDKVQVYVDNAMILHVSITQRVPVARVFDIAGNSYYLDRNLNTMPLSDRYVHYTTVVTNVPVFTNDTLDRNFKAKIAALVKYIDRDTFWNAQISQVMVNDSMEFEMLPILGNHKIVFGDTAWMQKKFDNLFAFYNKILNRVGWDKYEVLDLRYDDQVVASPALPWKVPVDKAAANMNWVKSIIGDEPKQAQAVVSPVVKNVVVKPEKPVATIIKPQAVVNALPKGVVPATKKTVAKKPVKKPVSTSAAKSVKNDKDAKGKYLYKGN